MQSVYGCFHLTQPNFSWTLAPVAAQLFIDACTFRSQIVYGFLHRLQPFCLQTLAPVTAKYFKETCTRVATELFLDACNVAAKLFMDEYRSQRNCLRTLAPVADLDIHFSLKTKVASSCTSYKCAFCSNRNSKTDLKTGQIKELTNTYNS